MDDKVFYLNPPFVFFPNCGGERKKKTNLTCKKKLNYKLYLKLFLKILILSLKLQNFDPLS